MEKITKSDINNIADSFVRAFNGEPWNDKWNKDQAIERLTDIFESPKFEGAMELVNGKIAAVIFGRGERYYDGIHFQILEFWVDKSFQRQGIGGKLLEDFVEYLYARDINKIFLITMHGAYTEGFYEKHGFEIDDSLCLMH